MLKAYRLLIFGFKSMHPYLNIAVRAARRAGNIISRHYEQLNTDAIFEKGPNDLVTMVDKLAEEAIIDTIHKVYPHHGILAEESGSHPGEQCVWVIDPLDGTLNYVHGFPQFAVSIAVKYRNQVEHAVIYEPLSQELYTATRGAGAQLNNRRIRVTERGGLEGALLGCGLAFFNRDNTQTMPQLEILQSIFSQCADLRRTGSTALNLAYIAAGRLDGFWDMGPKEWDMAAGMLLVREAGGFVSDFKGENGFIESGNIIAGTRKVQTELLQIIQSQYRD